MYRANMHLNKGRHKGYFKPGDEVSEDHPSFKHWLGKGYLDKVSDESEPVAPAEPIEPEAPAEPAEPVEPSEDVEIINVDFITDEMAETLQEAGIITVSDLEDWTKDELVKLPGIGAKTAEKLLAL